MFHNGKMAALTIIMMIVLSGCGGGANIDSGKVSAKTEDSSNELAKQAAAEKVELVIATSSGATAEQFAKEMEGYQHKFPNFKLTFAAGNPKTLIETGQTIDILTSSVGLTPATLLTLELQSDISDLIKKYKYDLTRVEPSTIEIQRQLANGGIYGLPVNTTSGALFYNKDLFDRFGVAYPKDAMTWEELYDLAKKMTRTDSGQQFKGLTFAFQHMLFLNQLSAPHLDPKTNKAMFLQNNFIQAFENMARFYKIPGNELPGNKFFLNNQQDPFFKDKTVAMLLTLSTAGANFGDMNWDMVQMPTFKEKPGVGPQSYPYYYYVTNMSKHRDAAFQLLSYITSDEYQEQQGKNGVPTILKDKSKVLQSFGVNQPLYKGKNIKSMLPEKFAEPTMKTRFQAIADKEALAALGEYTSGKDLNTVLREAAERADKEIATQQGK
jgi:multiple sugar transport system substrate-binding protein